MQFKLIDIHCHLDFPEFDKDREEVIKRALDAGIGMINVGTDYESSKKVIEIADEYASVYATVGLHPNDDETSFNYEKFLALAKHSKVVGIGECGIDLFRQNKNDFQRQKEIFKKQIELALEVNKPLMIHCREAHKDLIEILTTFYSIHSTNYNGNIHFFSGSWEEAQKYLDLGFTISFAGPITFTNQYDEIIEKAPVDKIMAETDSPFAAPIPFRGHRNEPFYVQEIVKKIAQIKNLTYEEICEITTKNALRSFFKNAKV